MSVVHAQVRPVRNRNRRRMGHRTRFGAVVAAALAVLGATVTATAASAQAVPETARAAVIAAATDLGPNVKVFDPSMWHRRPAA